jgi:hypothetical protein
MKEFLGPAATPVTIWSCSSGNVISAHSLLGFVSGLRPSWPFSLVPTMKTSLPCVSKIMWDSPTPTSITSLFLTTTGEGSPVSPLITGDWPGRPPQQYRSFPRVSAARRYPPAAIFAIGPVGKSSRAVTSPGSASGLVLVRGSCATSSHARAPHLDEVTSLARQAAYRLSPHVQTLPELVSAAKPA